MQTARGGVTFHDRNSSYCGHYVYAPSCTFDASAKIIDMDGQTVHAWCNRIGQPDPSSNPSSFLLGWHHVELDSQGNLLAIVPHHALLKLDYNSRLIWKSDIAAHHDIDIAPNGDIYTITETPRRTYIDDRPCLILDHEITIVCPVDGSIKRSSSIYDVLLSDPLTARTLRGILDQRRSQVECAHLADRLRGGSRGAQIEGLLDTGVTSGELRDSLCTLKEIPTSPCDIVHLNSVAFLEAHPKGLWTQGDLLVSARNLDLVFVVDAQVRRVIWAWGPGKLSRQHQPSMLPNGNVLIFDNSPNKKRSRIIEVDPIGDSVRWVYAGVPPESFFCEFAGGCEMLPNGNILVSVSQQGRAFEITRDGWVVWDWLVPGWLRQKEKVRSNFYRLSRVDDDCVGLLKTDETRENKE